MFSETGATKSSVQPDCSDHTCCFVPYLDCHNSASLFPWDIHKWIYSGSDLSQTVKKCHIVIRLTVCESQAIFPVFFCCVNHFSKHPAGSLCISGFQIIICKRHFTAAQMTSKPAFISAHRYRVTFPRLFPPQNSKSAPPLYGEAQLKICHGHT